jgi:hypothetical protein
LKGCFEDVQGKSLKLRRRGKRRKKKKKMAIYARFDIFLPHVPSRNGGNVARIKTQSWKLEFGC